MLWKRVGSIVVVVGKSMFLHRRCLSTLVDYVQEGNIVVGRGNGVAECDNNRIEVEDVESYNRVNLVEMRVVRIACTVERTS